MVYLIYEDDYGSTFSPYFLTNLFREREEAEAYLRDHPNAIMVQARDLGDELRHYPKTKLGLFSDD